MPATGSPSRNPCLPGPNRSSAIAEVLMRCQGLASVAEENVGVGGLEAPDGAFQNFVAPGPARLVAAALASHLEDGPLRRLYDRQRVESGKRGSVRVALGCRRIPQQTKK